MSDKTSIQPSLVLSKIDELKLKETTLHQVSNKMVLNRRWYEFADVKCFIDAKILDLFTMLITVTSKIVQNCSTLLVKRKLLFKHDIVNVFLTILIQNQYVLDEA